MNLNFNVMANYYYYCKTEISKLLDQLSADERLKSSIDFLLENAQLTQIFPNQIVNALRVGAQIKADKKNTALVAPMQSGKSGTLFVLCNYVMPCLGLIEENQSVIFVTSMSDTDLYDQNDKNLSKEFYCPVEKKYKHSYLYVVKMCNFFSHPNPYKIVRDLNIKLVVRDEDQYGCGQESSFDNAFFGKLRSKLPNIKLLSVSATPYDILDAQFKGAEVEVVEGERPDNYFGVTEMLKEGIIENYNRDFHPVIFDPENENEQIIHPKLEEYIGHLLSFDDGLGIIRVSNTNTGINARDIINEKHKDRLKCFVIGSNPLCDFKIQEGLAEVRRMVIRQQEKIVLIVVHALSAGKDLRDLKSKVRFGIESRNKQLANGAQGIAGRLCGYHKNRDMKILASVDLLKHYSRFEQDWEIFGDEVWRNELYNLKVRGLSTQTKFQLNRQEGLFTPIDEISLYSKEDLNNEKTRKALSFIDDENYEVLKNCFSADFYNSLNKGFKLGQRGTTVRAASSYNPASNRVYKNWGSDYSNDFGSVFFKKNQYKYGLLISNYPVNDPRNTIGFCGIKVFKSGESFMADQETLVSSFSMYAEKEDELLDSFVGMLGSPLNIERI